MSGGRGAEGLDPVAEAFFAGVLHHLPALTAFTTPSPNSFHRLQPQTWSGAYLGWGVDNREVPLRLTGATGDGANVELKAFDATANPHYALAAVVLAGMEGMRHTRRLPPPLGFDPGTLTEEGRAERGILRLPASLGEALHALAADQPLRASLASGVGFGSASLLDAFVEVRRSEEAHFSGWPLEKMAAALQARY